MNSLAKLTLLETKMFFRDKGQVFWTFLFPVLMVWLFGSMFKGAMIGNLTFGEAYIPSWIGVNILTTAFFTLGTVLTNYRENGILRRYQSTPLAPWKILFAHTIQGTVIFAGSAVILVLFGMGMFDLKMPVYFGSTLLALALSIFCFFPFGLLITSLAKNTQTAAAISSLFLNLMLFLSGATFPVESMPTILQYVGKALPLYYVIDLLRETWTNSPIWDNWQSVIILFLIGTVSLILSTRYFRWSAKH